MKESYGEGLANHTSLESCGNCSNVKAEAQREAQAGLLSSEITYFRVPTKWSDGEGNICCSDMQVAEQPGGVLGLLLRRHLLEYPEYEHVVIAHSHGGNVALRAADGDVTL